MKAISITISCFRNASTAIDWLYLLSVLYVACLQIADHVGLVFLYNSNLQDYVSRPISCSAQAVFIFNRKNETLVIYKVCALVFGDLHGALVLPPGEFNGTIPEPFSVYSDYSETFATTAVTFLVTLQ